MLICREKSKKKKKPEKPGKGKQEKKTTPLKSSVSKSAPKPLGESFKSKEFVSSDESSSGEDKKEVGALVAVNWRERSESVCIIVSVCVTILVRIV